MGNWTIRIDGTGAHHNESNETDANRMAVRFVDQLKDAGHHVEGASFTHGVREDLMNPNERTRLTHYAPVRKEGST